MRVLGLVQQYVPRSRVGAWITTHEYLAELVARGHQVDVVTTQTRDAPYRIDGIQVWPNGSDVDTPDLVVSHLGDTSQVATITEQLGVPSVRMCHGHNPHNHDRLTLQPPTLAVYSSQALRDDIGWDGPGLVAHPPVRAADYRVRPGKAVTLSNLSIEKGVGLFSWVAEALPDREFLGVRGWGYQIDQHGPNVRVVNPVVDMRAVYRQTRILLMPSEIESYGRCAVEAACSGIPTIAHPSPGLVEAMGDAATWIDRTDRQAWIDTVRALLDDVEAWRAASKRARAAIQPDPDATVALVADAIEALL